MKKIKITLLSLVLVLSLLPSMALANENVEQSLQKQAITSYLNAIQNQDVETIMNLVVDGRYSSKDEMKHSYENMLRYKRNQITKTKIEQEITAQNGDVTYVVEMTANDGSIESTPFTVKNINGQWIVVVEAGKDSQETPLYVNKKIATVKEDVKADVQLTQGSAKSSEFSIQAQLMDYNFSSRLEGTKFYSIQTFDFAQNQLDLTYRQWCDSNLGRIITTNITYAVVIEKWGNDTVWGSVQVVANNETNSKTVKISGDTKGLKGAKLRFIIPAYTDIDKGKVSFAGIGNLST